MPLEFAEGAISFNPQPTARNFNKPARMLRFGLKGRRKLYRNIRGRHSNLAIGAACPNEIEFISTKRPCSPSRHDRGWTIGRKLGREIPKAAWRSTQVVDPKSRSIRTPEKSLIFGILNCFTEFERSIKWSKRLSAHRRVGSRSILRCRDHVFALVAEDLEDFVEDRSQFSIARHSFS